MVDFEFLGILLLVFVLGFFFGKLIYETYVNKKEKRLDDRMANIENEYKQIIDNAEAKAKDIVDNAQKDADKKMERVEKMENKVFKREENVDKKLEDIEGEKNRLKDKEKEIDDLLEKQKDILSEISNLSMEEAKERLFEQIKYENEQEINKYIEKYKQIMHEEADKQASSIISRVLPRVGMNEVSEFASTIVDIPSEETKGKIIGKEGRNISYFERITGTEIIIDDTPYVVNISSFDPERRYIAVETLKRLIKDGRINPVYIKDTYDHVVNNFDSIIEDKGKEALSMLNMPMMSPDIVYMIGQFYLRFSYGQNLRIHSIEVARISEMIANELGVDSETAKKAGLLHDIGKVKTGNGESHTRVGADILRKYGFEDSIINTAEGHHFDVELNYTIGWIVTAADVLSSSRPGARFNTKDLYLERMENLEQLITSISGVEKVYIMQAGREIMVFVDPEKINDFYLNDMIKDVGEKIEDQLDYPGSIRVVAIRENKVMSYLR